MRAGTSRGPFLDLRDLPDDPAARDQVLLRIMGSPDGRQIDGIGGATAVTSKVVMAQPSDRDDVDVDYLFAQVSIDMPIVDTAPTCGNMMSGVGHLAIERGWVTAVHPTTSVRIYDLSTNAYIEAVIDTPLGQLNYVHGRTSIDGVPGSAAPVSMNLSNVTGGATGLLFPLGKQIVTIQNKAVSMVDAGNLMILMKATEFGLDGTEDPEYFRTRHQLMTQLESIRLEGGLLAGLGDVSQSVLPKIGLLSQPQSCGSIKSQYFTPKTLHATHAVSGAVCISTAIKAGSTVASELAVTSGTNPERLIIEHPSGMMPIELEVRGKDKSFEVIRAGIIGTVRKLMDGYVYY